MRTPRFSMSDCTELVDWVQLRHHAWRLGAAAALPTLVVGMAFGLTLKETVLSACCFVLFVYTFVSIVCLCGLLLGISLSSFFYVYDKTEKYLATAIKSFKIVLGMLLISLLLYVIIKYTCCVLAALIVLGMGSGGGRHEGAGSVDAA